MVGLKTPCPAATSFLKKKICFYSGDIANITMLNIFSPLKMYGLCMLLNHYASLRLNEIWLGKNVLRHRKLPCFTVGKAVSEEYGFLTMRWYFNAQKSAKLFLESVL